MGVLVVGAGFSGATVARSLAEAGILVHVIDERCHLAGNCHTDRDSDTGILVHRYGPHIFHTDCKDVWDFVGRFADFELYRHRVKTTAKGQVFSLPINLHTINQVFESALGPDEALLRIASGETVHVDKNFETRGRRLVGDTLFELFFAGYTRKQWGRSPSDLPAEIFSRLPLRFTYDDCYFDHRFQGLPKDGYTQMVRNMLDHPMIETSLGRPFTMHDRDGYQHVFYTGALDRFFEHRLGWLPYRTLDFDHEMTAGDFQGCPVMNYSDETVPFTRITEHKHFAPWEKHEKTIYSKEYARDARPGDVLYYPLRALSGKDLLKGYVELARRERQITFLGRLGTFRYLDMDKAISEARFVAGSYLNALRADRPAEVFYNAPI